MEFEYRNKDNYDKKIRIQGSSCPYYSKKAMKKLYPKGDFNIAGSIGNGLKKTIGTLNHRNKAIEFYSNNYSRMRFKLVGYIAVGEHQYIEVVKSKGWQRLLLLFLLIALLVGSLLFFMKGSDIDSNARDYTPTNGMEIQTDPDHIALPAYEKLSLKAGTDVAYVALFNPPNNPCYFKFTIYLKDSNSQIYQSELIPPGQAVTEVKFNQKFQEGIYPINIKIDTYSLDKKESLNGGMVESRLIAIEK